LTETRKFKARFNKYLDGVRYITKGKVYPAVLETRSAFVLLDDGGENFTVFKGELTEVKEPDYADIATAAFYKGRGDWEDNMRRAAEAIITAYKEYTDAE